MAYVYDDDWLRQIEMDNEYSFLTDDDINRICNEALYSDVVSYSDATIAA